MTNGKINGFVCLFLFIKLSTGAKLNSNEILRQWNQKDFSANQNNGPVKSNAEMYQKDKTQSLF